MDGNTLKAVFHNPIVNISVLMEITFDETGFAGKWKNGLEPGPMRGKWNGECVSEGGGSPLSVTLTPDQLKWIETKDSWDYEEAPKEWLDSKDLILVAMKKDESILGYSKKRLRSERN